MYYINFTISQNYKMQKKKIAIIDDHVLFLTGIAELIKKEFKAETTVFSIPQEFLANNITDLDLLITDIEMDRVSGVDLVSKLRERNVKYPILVISMHNKLSVIKKCKQLGVNGYLLKDDSNNILFEAINSLFRGETYFSEKVTKTLESVKEYDKDLTPREEEIIRCLTKGMESKEIADNLFISVNTVKTHRRNLKSKLGLETTADIIKYAIDNFIFKEKEYK